MNIILTISLIFAALSGIFSLIRQFQMLQQNSYFPSRYFKWVKSSYTVDLCIDCMLFCLSSSLYLGKRYILQSVLTALILAVRIFSAIRTQKHSVKKLVYTARIKRLFAAVIIIFTALAVLYILFPASLAGEISSVLLFMITFIPPLATLLGWCVTFPVEKTVSQYYINDAKRILKKHSDLTVIGVTGSYGKTTTKFILERILSEHFNVVATPQSFNTPMGVVRTVRNMIKPQTQIFICEMGAKKRGDIKEICDIATPTHGIITSVGAQHLETFKTVDCVFSTKFELARAVQKNGGAVFVNGESAELKSRLENRGNYRVYGLDSNQKYYAENISYGRAGSSFTLVLDGEKISVTTKLLGIHSVINIVGAAALAHTLGVTADEIKFAIAALKPTEHRLELKNFKNNSLLIDDAYNANPEGCLEAVRVLGSFDGMKKTIITPGLIELGAKEYEANFSLGAEAAKYCDRIILVGLNRSKPIRDGVESVSFPSANLHTTASFAEAMKLYLSFADKNSIVLLENDLPDNYLN